MKAQVRKTQIKLADGRALYYFDDDPAYVSGEKTRCDKDERPLGNRYETFYDEQGHVIEENLPQMRYDVLMGEWIPMATHRMNRTFMPAKDANPLAPKNPDAKYSDGEIPDTDYNVVVFENRFPSLMAVPEAPFNLKQTGDKELFFSAPANGRCEVVCFGPDIDTPLVQMGKTRMRTVIEAWADRTAELMEIPQIQQVYCFENHGQEIGVTLQHPHGQIYAYPYITPRMAKISESTQIYKLSTGANLFEDMLQEYLDFMPELVIYQGQHWVLYVPYAAKWPLQMHLMPKEHVGRIDQLNDAQRDELAEIYLKMIDAANHFFEKPDGSFVEVPYISSWNQAPKGDEDIRLFCDFFSFQRSADKLKYLAGSESGMGAWISDTVPEKIAQRLHEVF